MKKIITFFVFVVLGIFSYYFFKQTLLIYSINDTKNIPIKKDLIEQMTQKREIIDVIKNAEEKLYKDYYVKVKESMSSKLHVVCYRQFVNIVKNNANCQLEELDVDGLKELDTLYESIISGLLKVQDEVIKIEEKRLATLASPSPDKSGWMRYISRDNMYTIDFPNNLSINMENKDTIHFGKSVAGMPANRESDVYIQKDAASLWDRKKYDKLMAMKINETVEKIGCEYSIDDFCAFTRLPDVYVAGKQMRLFTSEKISDFPNKITLYLYINEGNPGYVIGFETNKKDTRKTSISYYEFKEIISTMKFLE